MDYYTLDYITKYEYIIVLKTKRKAVDEALLYEMM